MNWFKKITESGVPLDRPLDEQRPVMLSNYISLILVGVNVLIFLFDPAKHNLDAFFEMLMSAGVFSIPILLNYFRYHTLAKLFLCWAPPVYVTSFTLLSLQDSPVIAIATIDGLKLYLLAYSCIPYLIIERSNIFIFLLGIAPCFLCLFFPEVIIELLDAQVARKDESLAVLTLHRSFISYLVINASCLALRVLLEKGERDNRRLLEEIGLKNELIREQSANEVNQLNAQLMLNLQQVSEREFILNQSQKIARVGSWEYRLKDKFVFLSDEMYNIFGIQKEVDFHISDLDIILGTHQREVFVSLSSNLIRTGKPYELTLLFNTPLGLQKWVRVYAFPIEENGEVTGIRGIGHDITIYKETEERMKENELKYRSLFEQASDAILVMDLKGKIIDVNERMTFMSGYSRLDLIQINIADLLLTNDAETDLKELFDRLAKGEKIFNEARLKHRNGTILEIEANTKMSSENRIMSIVRDVTERKRNEQELILSQANLNSTINNTEILICSVDRDFNLITFNKPFFNYIRNNYNIELKVGTQIFLPEENADLIESNKNWRQLFLRSLAGEIVNFENTRLGRDLHYSLNPIIEANKIIGVSIFVEDVSERKRYIRELAETNRQLAETKLMALRSVMSPHFIFNVLSSIQFYISKSDRENAIHYLSTFSKLIRSILNQSVNNKVKLSEEIDLLKNYVELELSRFENKFDFILDTDRVEDDEVEIPSLLIQPYVENAILHGLYNKHSKGTLWIRFISEPNELIVEIEDNGIGREEALRIKQSGIARHKSMGLKLTEERLRLINQYKNTSFEVFDLKDASGNASGTRIRIIISGV